MFLLDEQNCSKNYIFFFIKTYTNKKEGIRLESYFDQIEFKLLFFLKKQKRYHIIN
jgi:hypothetical protein